MEHTEDTVAAQARHIREQLTEAEKISFLHQYIPAIERLGIEAFHTGNEVLHGQARQGIATVFPQPVGLGATWDSALIEAVGDAVATEVRAKHAADPSVSLNVWAPVVNPLRHPAWGRNEEGYSEDPHLTGYCGRAYARGLRGGQGAIWKTVPTLKHFLGYNNETDQATTNASLDLRTLHEEELAAFRAPIEAGVIGAILPSRNLVSGRPAHVAAELLDEARSWTNEPLAVMSDVAAPSNLVLPQRYFPHHAAATAAALKAGLDSFTDHDADSSRMTSRIKRALDAGLVSIEVIDRAVERVLMVRLRTGEFSPDHDPYRWIGENEVGRVEHCRLARRAAAAGVVILRNERVLPLRVGSGGDRIGPMGDAFHTEAASGQCTSRVAVVGPLADTVLRDRYSGSFPYTVSIAEAFAELPGVTVATASGADIVAIWSTSAKAYVRVVERGLLAADPTIEHSAVVSLSGDIVDATDPAAVVARHFASLHEDAGPTGSDETEPPLRSLTVEAAQVEVTEWGDGVLTLRSLVLPPGIEAALTRAAYRDEDEESGAPVASVTPTTASVPTVTASAETPAEVSEREAEAEETDAPSKMTSVSTPSSHSSTDTSSPFVPPTPKPAIVMPPATERTSPQGRYNNGPTQPAVGGEGRRHKPHENHDIPETDLDSSRAGLWTSQGWFLEATASRVSGWVSQESFRRHQHADGTVSLLHLGTGRWLRVQRGSGLIVAEAQTLDEAEHFDWQVVRSGTARVAEALTGVDAVIVAVGNDPHLGGREGEDRPGLTLPVMAKQVWRQARASHPKAVLAIISSYPYVLGPEFTEAQAIVWSCHAGQELGHGLVDVLTGAFEPAGHLAQSWPASSVDAGDLFTYDARRERATYRHARRAPLFAFGHGLSYTSVVWEKLELSHAQAEAPAATWTHPSLVEYGPMAADSNADLSAAPWGEAPGWKTSDLTKENRAARAPEQRDHSRSSRPSVPMGLSVSSEPARCPVTQGVDDYSGVSSFAGPSEYGGFGVSGGGRRPARDSGPARPGMIRAFVTVHNTGARPVSQLVALYALPPKGLMIPPARRRLIAFRRAWLKPGERRVVDLDIDLNHLAVWDVNAQAPFGEDTANGPGLEATLANGAQARIGAISLQPGERDWVHVGALRVQPGIYTIAVGNSSFDLAASARFEVTGAPASHRTAIEAPIPAHAFATAVSLSLTDRAVAAGAAIEVAAGHSWGVAEYHRVDTTGCADVSIIATAIRPVAEPVRLSWRKTPSEPWHEVGVVTVGEARGRYDWRPYAIGLAEDEGRVLDDWRPRSLISSDVNLPGGVVDLRLTIPAGVRVAEIMINGADRL
ncbi:MAG: glycoside hydrolase family 3 C-terminal domain-containing protein [Propionibacteriaceae bacterium]|jgi:beta-glucosidase-like glycosyl hydrolase|nr:glycoside hydrolase family 3 C-terminal domain-containing protein [Propionibacteriaceae bacterium]